MVTAVATTSVPKITMLVGGSFGAGNYGMAGRAYSAAVPVDLAQFAHLGDGRGAGGRVLATVKRDAMEKRGETWSADDEAAFKRPTVEMFERQSAPALCQRAALG